MSDDAIRDLASAIRELAEAMRQPANETKPSKRKRRIVSDDVSDVPDLVKVRGRALLKRAGLS